MAEVRIVAASAEAAREVAEVIRHHFRGAEQRSYPAGAGSTGTRLHLTVDTTAAGHRSAREASDTSAPHADEIRSAGTAASRPERQPEAP
nr:hypothetical protein [Streptomyces sp. YIM 98790]